MEQALKEKNAVIVGAAGGVGSGYARYFARQGARLICNDVGYAMMPGSGDYDTGRPGHGEADRVTAQVRALGAEAEADYEDVSTWEGARRVIEHCVAAFGSVDVVVHAANVSRLNMLDTMTEEEWDLVIRQNMYPDFFLVRHSLPYMKRQNYGRHIFIGSATVRDMWGAGNYAAASGGRYSLVRDLACEVQDYDITANMIEPWTQTKTGQRPAGQEMLRRRQEALHMPPQDLRDVDAGLPEGDTNAPLGAFLCTRAGRRYNGQYFGNRFGRICIFSTMTELRYVYKDIERNGYWTVEELERVLPPAFEGAVQPLWHPRV